MAINTIDFSNWPDWDDRNWQESIYRSLSNKRDKKDQIDLTSSEKEILEALEKKELSFPDVVVYSMTSIWQKNNFFNLQPTL